VCVILKSCMCVYVSFHCKTLVIHTTRAERERVFFILLNLIKNIRVANFLMVIISQFLKTFSNGVLANRHFPDTV